MYKTEVIYYKKYELATYGVMSLFTTKNKEEIIKAAQNNNEDAIEYLIENNMDIVHYKANSFFIKGQDKDDVIQEGRIGLYKAIKNYKIEGDASFISFCNLCVYRQLITAIKKANRDKHLCFNHSISMDKPFGYNKSNKSKRSLNNTIPDKKENVENNILSKELFNRLFTELKNILTKLEWSVFKLYLDDKSYQKISEILEIDKKCVDNDLQRVREKNRRY